MIQLIDINGSSILGTIWRLTISFGPTSKIFHCICFSNVMKGHMNSKLLWQQLWMKQTNTKKASVETSLSQHQNINCAPHCDEDELHGILPLFALIPQNVWITFQKKVYNSTGGSLRFLDHEFSINLNGSDTMWWDIDFPRQELQCVMLDSWSGNCHEHRSCPRIWNQRCHDFLNLSHLCWWYSHKSRKFYNISWCIFLHKYQGWSFLS